MTFEILKIRNEEKNKIIRMIRKRSKKDVKIIKNSGLRCYDYSDVEDTFNELIADILDDKHWRGKN